jgi:hypothetical protein
MGWKWKPTCAYPVQVRAAHLAEKEAAGIIALSTLGEADMSKTSGAAEFLKRSCEYTDRKLEEYIPKESDSPQTLHKAMRYSIFAGGKRLRPALALAAAEAVGGTFDDAAPVACALEMTTCPQWTTTTSVAAGRRTTRSSAMRWPSWRATGY